MRTPQSRLRAQPAEAGPGDGQAAARPARWHAALTTLHRHWLVGLLLGAGLVLRVLTQLAYQPALFYIDSARYLYNAEGMDPVGYKGPLRVILFVSNFGAVVAIQHLLGLAMAVLIYLLLIRRGAPRWLAALAAAPVLLDAYQLQIEQLIMPDTWFESLIVAGLAILVWEQRPGWRRAVAGGIMLGTSAIVAQVGEALLLPAVIYVLVAGGGWRPAVTRAMALCGAFALPIVLYSTGSLLLTGNFFLSHTGVTSLYGRLASAVDCATIRLPQAERGLCPDAAQQALGPDGLEYDVGSPVRHYYADLPRARTDSLITDFNRQVLAQQPLRVLASYGEDAAEVFALTRDGRAGDAPISRWQFQTSFPYFSPHASPAVVRAAISQYGGGRPTVWQPVARFLRTYQLRGGYTPGPLLALCVIAGLAGSALLARRRADPQASSLTLACLLFFTAAGAVTLVSDVFEFSWRYQLPALVTLVPAGALGIGAILRLRASPGSATQPAAPDPQGQPASAS